MGKEKKPWIKNKLIREWTEALLFAFVVAFIFRMWLYAPFRVPSGSMIPTIDVGDHIFADMSSYGYVVPFTDIKLLEKDIQRGDVVIFPSPLNPPKCESSFYSAYDTIVSLFGGLLVSDYVPNCIDLIKRVVAVGGDTVEFQGEKLFVNGQEEKNYTPFFNANAEPVLLFYTDKVPENSVLTLGDNRRDSLDARFWRIDGKIVSFVAKQRIRAKARWIYLSIDPRVGIFGGLRLSRMFTTIH